MFHMKNKAKHNKWTFLMKLNFALSCLLIVIAVSAYAALFYFNLSLKFILAFAVIIIAIAIMKFVIRIKDRTRRKWTALMKVNVALTCMLSMSIIFANTVISYQNGSLRENIAFAHVVANNLSTANTIKGTEKNISVRVKANVPDGFSGDISVSYEGNNGASFSATLNKDNHYTQDAVIEKDDYILKSKTTTQTGYKVDSYDSFSLSNATTDKVYLLNVSVSQLTNSDIHTKTASISVKAQVPNDYKDDISVVYDGSNNNQLSTVLTKKDNYTSTVAIPLDVYSLQSITAGDDYTAESIESFDISNADTSKTYLLTISVNKVEKPKGADATELVPLGDSSNNSVTGDNSISPTVIPSTDANTITNTDTSSSDVTAPNTVALIHADVPDDFDKSIYVCYTGKASKGFNTELNKVNNYSVSLPLDEDIYTFLYAQTAEQTDVTFDCPDNFQITSNMTSPCDVAIKAVSSNNSNKSKSTKIKKGGFSLGSFKIDQNTVVGIFLLFGGIAFFVMKHLNKKKAKKKPSFDDKDDLDEDEEDK